MELCSKHHEEVCFEGRNCPCCEAMSELEKKISELENELNDAKEEIADIIRTADRADT